MDSKRSGMLPAESMNALNPWETLGAVEFAWRIGPWGRTVCVRVPQLIVVGACLQAIQNPESRASSLLQGRMRLSAGRTVRPRGPTLHDQDPKSVFGSGEARVLPIGASNSSSVSRFGLRTARKPRRYEKSECAVTGMSRVQRPLLNAGRPAVSGGRNLRAARRGRRRDSARADSVCRNTPAPRRSPAGREDRDRADQ